MRSSKKKKKMARLYGSKVIPIKPEQEFNDIGDWSHELDHLPLLQRRRLLLSGKPNRTSNFSVVVKKEYEDSQEVSVSASSANVREGSKVAVNQCLQNGIGGQDLVKSGDCSSQGTKVNAHVCLDQNLLVQGQPAEAEVKCSYNNVQSTLGDSMTGSAGADLQTIKVKSNSPDDCADDLDHVVLRVRQGMLLSRKMLRLEKTNLEGLNMESNSCQKLHFMPATADSMACSSLSTMINVKAEPLDNNELHNRISVSNFSNNKVPVKTELEIPNKLYKDKLDHMQLQDRIKMPIKWKSSKSKISGNSECLHKAIPSDVEYGSTVPDPIRFIQPRKRKKTATDSVETALEEDAPGLLQVLVEQGVSLEEIKLYGEADDDEAIDESFIEDGFGELEAVMSKLLFQRSSLLKLAPIQCAKASRPSYCLECLFSLVEQTRHLRFRNWPAEWGWCRDLQSFVFVFKKHNRIVLERPEYGYATYFFELVDSMSIDWQIKRLVTAMKLTNCGRVGVVENRPLSVGEDITEGEAQVLMQYGWTPNSGLGTMLNYCDRVFHDRKNEKDSSEWRSKIGKLLMNGYNGGSIVSNNIETELIQQTSAESPQIKMEL
ncbi:PREDICTED: uncharacterized protein LOC105108806 isoform X1 [Populus euphratica]|uniref:Uncharacterized protein LOC105108806 isoform X1 n=1 Tax=Populus euphratica TaxID=75702 RepID=A0AAJ6SZ00_POPEU|nr:PREDICTED: uncharacterized protein LOC105108806 isoform X1 [Populus euphratica]